MAPNLDMGLLQKFVTKNKIKRKKRKEKRRKRNKVSVSVKYHKAKHNKTKYACFVIAGIRN